MSIPKRISISNNICLIAVEFGQSTLVFSVVKW